MSRLLALEWNAAEARLAVIGSRGDQPVVEHAFSVDLRSGQPEGEEPSVDAGGRIAAALAARHLGRLDTLVAIGRTNIELRKLTFPPVPDEELPDVVRFQALREFNALEANWPLDFIPIEEVPEQPRSVLAAAIDPELVGQVQQTCGAAGLKPRRLLLRPCAAASLLCRGGGDRLRPVTLLIDLLMDEADLTVVCDRQVVFLRTARLQGDPLVDEGAAQALLGEIRRTVAAAQNQLSGRLIESLVLCGSGTLHTELAAVIRRQFGTATELFDPFSGVTLSAELERALPDHPGRFAPLLGALLDETDEARHAIDFLHPRQRPAPPSRNRLYVAVGGGLVALAVALAIGGTFYGNHLKAEIADLAGQSTALDAEVQDASKVRSSATEIGKWAESDFCWLEELRWLSENFPSAQDAMLTEMQMQPRVRDGKTVGGVTIKGLAQSVEAIRQGEANLRDERHQIIGNEATEERSERSYAWRFSSSLFVDRQEQ